MWDNLTDEQKRKYREYCDSKYGKTIVSCETGEPMYLDENARLIDTSIVISLLFNININ